MIEEKVQISIFDFFEFQEYMKDESFVKFTYPEQLQKVQDLVNYLKMTYKQAAINLIELEESQFLITFPLETYNSEFTLQFEIDLNFTDLDTTFKVILIDQNGRIQVNCKNIRIQLCRYMLRLNSGLRVGSFFIHPLDGYIGLKLQCYNGMESLIYSSTQDFQQFIKYLDSLIQTAIYSFQFHFLRLMILINRINIKQITVYEKYMRENKQQEGNNKGWRRYPPEIIPLLQRIKTIINTNLDIPFTKEQYTIYGPLLSKQVQSDSKIINPISVNSSNELLLEKKHEINSGGFSFIYGKDVQYNIEKNSQQINLKRHLVIKVDKKPEMQKIKKEIQILQILSNENQQNNNKNKKDDQEYFKFTGTCPYIAQFYYIKENLNFLFMERYYYSSLDNFIVKMQDCLSLSSKIFIAHNIAMGLRYFHQYNIIHMDIKPANILISKTLMAKITDFGEAINKNETENTQPGKTLPYCAPEIEKKQEKESFTFAYDIFSFGVLLFELLYERNPIDFRHQNMKILQEQYLKWSYKVRYDENYEKTQGPQKMMKYLGRLCFACLQPDPKFRPNIDKIVLILKDCLSYLDKMY